MKRTELTTAVDACISETRNALQTVYDALNPGQQKQIVKDQAVKELFDRYDVRYD